MTDPTGALRRSKAALAVALLVWLLAPPAAVNAAPAVPGGWMEMRAGAMARLEAVRSLVRSGGLVGAARAAASLAGVSSASAPRLAGPVPDAVPAPIAPQVARLAGAVRYAEAAVDRAVRISPGRLARAERGLRRMIALAHQIDSDPSALSRILAFGQRYEGAVDLPSLYTGVLALARALHAALPTLLAYAASAPAGAAAGCDVAEQHPALCIGGSGASTYEKDYALLIDLGGNDLHANSAGGADRATNGLAVAVTVDLGGDDRYETLLPAASGSRVAQGAGQAGIGVLLDAAGDDTYSATSATTRLPARAQGVGSLGFGMLADLGGNDSYVLRNVAGDQGFQETQGQSYAVAGGSVLMDESGNDSYLNEVRSRLFVDEAGLVFGGRPNARGMGFSALGGTAIFADAGGTDTAVLQAVAAPIAPDEPREIGYAGGNIEGAGYAFIGSQSVVLAGAGSTTWSIRAEARAPITGQVLLDAFAIGQIGYAALHDEGGNDAYVAEASSLAEARRSVDEGCGCPGAQASAQAGSVEMLTAAVGGAGVGLLQDASGDDRYRTVATVRAVSEARDPRTTGAEAVAGAAAAYGEVATQGFGSVGGAGLLDDGNGNDTYEATVTSEAQSTALAPSGNQAASFAERARSWAQAVGSTGGYGELRDSRGRDAYSSLARTAATSDPPVESTAEAPVSSVQGSAEVEPIQGVPTVGGFALFVDADGGAADVFSATPPDTACTGTRGQGIWRDCGGTAGVGVNS